MDQLWRQVVGAVAVLAFSFIATFAIAKVLDATVGLRVSEEHEDAGVDATVHAEQSYDLGAISS